MAGLGVPHPDLFPAVALNALARRPQVHDLQLDVAQGSVRVECDGVRLVGPAGGDDHPGQVLPQLPAQFSPVLEQAVTL